MDGGLTPDTGLNPHLVRPLSGFTLLIRWLTEQEVGVLLCCLPGGWARPGGYNGEQDIVPALK